MDIVSTAATEATVEPNPQSSSLSCNYPSCHARFDRRDHLQRHELSHKFPEFVCPYSRCGMRFHRKDVLRRHESVHDDRASVRRRKPRRGALPRGDFGMDAAINARDSVTSLSCIASSYSAEVVNTMIPASLDYWDVPLDGLVTQDSFMNMVGLRPDIDLSDSACDQSAGFVVGGALEEVWVSYMDHQAPAW
jgi:hypothetical protein